MHRYILATLTALLFLSMPALGQQVEGDTEIQLQGSLNIGLDDEQADSGSGFVNYGRFITDRQEVGGTLAVFITGGAGNEDFTFFGGPFYRFNFPLDNANVVPFVGASVVGSFGDSQGVGDFLATFEGGARWFLDRNISFNLTGQTRYDIDRSDFSDSIQVLFGFSYFWS